MFPERPKFAKMENYYFTYGEHINSMYAHSYTHVRDFERRMNDAIDAGLILNDVSVSLSKQCKLKCYIFFIFRKPAK